ncbi:hypothetical protein CTheo_4321 [Ceratobasidium theobromae]|uniref:Uncharacterized protein n=1 Tax=Ceratobasidium theobromae TaxID=1582974 RepID=A0A5N5QKR0_9AGAM|nr:hypothetical protein CTheo_4321 [Ceratobasidium theobromae]
MQVNCVSAMPDELRVDITTISCVLQLKSWWEAEMICGGGIRSSSDPMSMHSQSSTVDESQKQLILQNMKSRGKPKTKNVLLIMFLSALDQAKVENVPDFDVIGALTQNPKFDLLLESILEKGEDADFLSIIDYLTLHPSKPREIANRGLFPPRSNYKEATHRAWSTPYRGETVNLLTKAIHQMNIQRGSKAYANFVPIVQSSGTGKSRAADELAKLIFTIPLNLRPSEDETGYPAGDQGLLGLLILGGGYTAASEIRIRYYIFFKNLFDEVKLALDKIESQKSQNELALMFYNYLANSRQELYQTVIKKTKEGYQTISTKAEEGEYSQPAFVSARDLIEMIRSKSKSAVTDRQRPVQLVIYFDEAHPLASTTITHMDGDGLTRYRVLCSVMDRFVPLDLFAIFLSTSPKLSSFSPPRTYSGSSSSRGWTEETGGIQAPFNELPFDQWEQEYLLEENKHTLKDVCSPGFMVRFGRPLFWTRYKYGDHVVQADIIGFAQMKLAGTERLEKLSSDGQLAVLGVRIGLSFNLNREKARFTEQRLVEGYMRIVFSVPKHREYIYSGYPSEPILAEAAAQLMCLNNMNDGIPSILHKWCENDLIAKGDRGELVARLLITKAHDLVIHTLPPASEPFLTFSTPILLTDFLQVLVGKELAQLIFDAVPDNSSDQTRLIDSALGKAKLNFTHWAKAADKGAVTDEAAWIGLARNMAWRCFDQQKAVDLITPLLLWDEKGESKLGPDNVSGIFWQIQHRNKLQKVEIDATDLEFFSCCFPDTTKAEKGNARPYLAIILDLDENTDKHSRKEDQNLPPIYVSTPRTSPRNASESHHPRYTIIVSGCSQRVFPMLIDSGEERKYAAILNPKTLLDEHARQGQDFRQAVEDLKYVWKSKGHGSFHQVHRHKSSHLNRSEDGVDDENNGARGEDKGRGEDENENENENEGATRRLKRRKV